MTTMKEVLESMEAMREAAKASYRAACVCVDRFTEMRRDIPILGETVQALYEGLPEDQQMVVINLIRALYGYHTESPG